MVKFTVIVKISAGIAVAEFLCGVLPKELELAFSILCTLGTALFFFNNALQYSSRS